MINLSILLFVYFCQHLEVALKGSITWDVETLRGWNHEINTTYRYLSSLKNASNILLLFQPAITSQSKNSSFNYYNSFGQQIQKMSSKVARDFEVSSWRGRWKMKKTTKLLKVNHNKYWALIYRSVWWMSSSSVLVYYLKKNSVELKAALSKKLQLLQSWK